LSIKSQACSISGITLKHADFVSNFGTIAYDSQEAPPSAAGARVLEFSEDGSIVSSKVADFVLKTPSLIKVQAVSSDST